MSELTVIANSKRCNTVETLIRDFRMIGLEEGDTVLVHSSLSAIGWVCGRETAVIEALLKTVGEEGTICMPAHSGDNSDPAEWENPPVPKEWVEIIRDNIPAFDRYKTPTSGMGRIAELFRTYPRTLRSNHPQTSFCANGKYAKEITEDHILTPQLGLSSPLGKLYQRHAKVLLLGVDYYSCTSFHLAEVFNGINTVRVGASIKIDGVRSWQWFNDYDYSIDGFQRAGEAFELQGHVVKRNIGSAPSRLFDMQKAVDFAAHWLKVNRDPLG